MPDRTRDGRAFRMLTIIDEYSRECLAIEVARRLNSEDVLEELTWLFTRAARRTHPFRQWPGVHGREGAQTGSAD